MPRGVYERKTAKSPTEDSDPPEVPVEESAPMADVGSEPADEVDVEPATEPAEPAVSPQGPDPVPCPTHFPNGWPDGVTSAGCVDGQWDRDLPEGEG